MFIRFSIYKHMSQYIIFKICCQLGSLTSINLALSNDIPVFNLGSKDKNKVLNDIKDFLDKNK